MQTSEQVAGGARTLQPGETAFRAYYAESNASWAQMSRLGREQWARAEKAVAAALRAQPERGAEEMRERAASVCERDSRQFFEHMLRHAADDEHEAAIHFTAAAMAASNLAKLIRALPLHPDKEGGGR